MTPSLKFSFASNARSFYSNAVKECDAQTFTRLFRALQLKCKETQRETDKTRYPFLMCALMKDNSKASSKNGVSQQVFGMDFDNATDEQLALVKTLPYEMIVYETPSSRIDGKPVKFRALIHMETIQGEEFHNGYRDSYEENCKRILAPLGMEIEQDRSCKNINRIFFLPPMDKLETFFYKEGTKYQFYYQRKPTVAPKSSILLEAQRAARTALAGAKTIGNPESYISKIPLPAVGEGHNYLVGITLKMKDKFQMDEDTCITTLVPHALHIGHTEEQAIRIVKWAYNN